MLARAEVAPPEGSPENTPWRAIDLALHLVQTTMRNKCVQSCSRHGRGWARALVVKYTLVVRTALMCKRRQRLTHGRRCAQDRVQRE